MAHECDRPVELALAITLLVLQVAHLHHLGFLQWGRHGGVLVWSSDWRRVHTAAAVVLVAAAAASLAVLSSHSGGGRTGGDCGAARWAVFGVQLALVLALTAGAGFLTTLWALGPPTYNRRDKTARAQAVHVDWLHADDLGDGADARTIVARHGRIGLCHCPGRFLELDEDIKALRQAALAAQCTAAPLPITLVSLMQQQEFDLMGVADFAARVEAAGIRLKLHPLRDKWFPPSVAALLKLIAELVWLLCEGHSVVIHCYGGKGRTGTVAGALLLTLRPTLSVGALKRLLRARRSGMLKNPLQQLWLNMYRFAAARAVRTHDDAQTPTSTSLLAEVRH